MLAGVIVVVVVVLNSSVHVSEAFTIVHYNSNQQQRSLSVRTTQNQRRNSARRFVDQPPTTAIPFLNNKIRTGQKQHQQSILYSAVSEDIVIIQQSSRVPQYDSTPSTISSSTSTNPKESLIALLTEREQHQQQQQQQSSLSLSTDEIYDVQDSINEFEDNYRTIQTLSFFNMALNGTWKLLFSTFNLYTARVASSQQKPIIVTPQQQSTDRSDANDDNDIVRSSSSSSSSSAMVTVHNITQIVSTEQFQGVITTIADWSLIEEDGNNKEESSSKTTTMQRCSLGTFTVHTRYRMNSNSGSRIYLGKHKQEDDTSTETEVLSSESSDELSSTTTTTTTEEEDDEGYDEYHPILQLHRGSAIPKDIQGLVQTLHTIIPSQLCICPDHAIDTTYLDESIRIVRYTGPKYEGIRDIYIRC